MHSLDCLSLHSISAARLASPVHSVRSFAPLPWRTITLSQLLSQASLCVHALSWDETILIELACRGCATCTNGTYELAANYAARAIPTIWLRISGASV